MVSNYERDWTGKSYHCLSTSPHKCGVSLLISKKSQITVNDVHYDKCGRKLIVNCELQNHHFSLVGVYAPTKVKQRKEFLYGLSNWVIQNATYRNNIILCGDLNTITSEADRTSGTVDYCTPSLVEMKSNLDITDTWTALNENKKRYTWIRYTFKS